MMATVCSNHQPLRKYISKIIIFTSQVISNSFPKFPKTQFFPLYFDHKTISIFIKEFQIIFSNKIGM
jgi:hypothetical protein